MNEPGSVNERMQFTCIFRYVWDGLVLMYKGDQVVVCSQRSPQMEIKRNVHQQKVVSRAYRGVVQTRERAIFIDVDSNTCLCIRLCVRACMRAFMRQCEWGAGRVSEEHLE